MKKSNKPISTSAASIQRATRAAVARGGRIGYDDLQSIYRTLENLSLIRDLRRHSGAEQKRVLANIEVMLFSHLASIRPGKLRLLDKTPSGASWVSKFPDSASTSDLADSFRQGVDSFISAMKDAGASVSIGSTLRPPERLYLMRNAWLIAKKTIRAEDVPPMDGVDIEWVHSSDAETVQAAQDMVDGYGLRYAPSPTSKHLVGLAIDMTITWSGTLSIANKDGTKIDITSTPRNGENSDLKDVGATYGVIKAVFSGDPPHWSDDGH